jgi:hypothetical protein
MDRTWLETVHFLGLDLELAVVAALCAFEGLRRLAEHLRRFRNDQRVPGQPPARPALNWPPSSWRSSH